MRISYLLLCLLFSFAMTAKEKDVRIMHENQSIKRPHMPAALPVVSHDDAILYIYSSRALDDINIQIKNVETGATVYEENACIMPHEKRPFMMNIGNGQYEIVLTIGDKHWAGYFDIETNNTY